ncbi:MAG: WecB/TagA/CpsF family glycosyltransferase [Verrucomicrobia bacterium]|nr:WecB/TagA/CpsF family glycosyltransferase [Verrucomicrobiota bacterium]
MLTMPPEPPLTVLLGLPFHDLTLEETLDYCTWAMNGDQSRYLVTANVDFTAQAYGDPDLKKIVFFADRVVCDGMPLVWLSRVFGHPLRERVAGSDLVPRLLESCGNAGHGVYFFGSDRATLEGAKVIVETRYPGLRVVGIDSPPIGAVIEWDNEALCERMRASAASLLLVCLGCPKQERWIFAHHRESGVPLCVGVGASLDFITGKQKRAPRWMQKSGLEWFWRMSGSPSRLVSRYRKDLVFLVRAAWQQARSQRRRKHLVETVREPARQAPSQVVPVTRIVWSGDLVLGQLTGAPVPESVGTAVLLDASQVTLMDSSGLGRLALLARRCRAAEHLLLVLQPSAAFRKPVAAARMEFLFRLADSEAAALALLAQDQTCGGVLKVAENGVVWVAFNRSLDALYHDAMLAILETAITDSAGIRVLVVDLKAVDFIDSRAVGGLIRAWKLMSAKGGQMVLAGITPAVREIITLLRLDQILAEWKGDPPA